MRNCVAHRKFPEKIHRKMKLEKGKESIEKYTDTYITVFSGI